MRKKSIYELALEEIDRQRKDNLPTITPERLQELKEEGRKLRKGIQDRLKPLLRGPSSMPPNVRSGQMNPMDVVVDGASNRRWGRGGGRNIQLD